MLVHSFNRGLAAKAATGRGEDMTGQALEIHFNCGREKDIQRVFRCLALQAWSYLNNFVWSLYETLRQEEPCGQFTIVPRRAHRYGNAAPPHADFEWLLPREAVGASFAFAADAKVQHLCTRSSRNIFFHRPFSRLFRHSFARFSPSFHEAINPEAIAEQGCSPDSQRRFP